MKVADQIHKTVCDCDERINREITIAGLDPEVVLSPENIKAILDRINAAFDEVRKRSGGNH